MWRSIVLWFLGLLLGLSPNSKSLIFSRDKVYYDKQTIADTVMTAIKEQDSKALEAMICKNIKDNDSDLSNQISALFGYAKGVTNYKVEGGGAEYSGNRGSNSILKRDVEINFTVSGVKYNLFIVWEINNFSPAEKGIRHVNLKTVDPRVVLVNFVSTEGFLQWHD